MLATENERLEGGNRRHKFFVVEVAFLSCVVRSFKPIR